MKKNNAGFVMVEAVVMTIILAVGLVGIVSAVRASIEVAEVSRESGMAEEIARTKLSEIELSPISALGTKEGTVTSGERKYGWRTEVAQTKEPELLSARVRVSYVVRGREREVALPGLIYQRSAGAQ